MTWMFGQSITMSIIIGVNHMNSCIPLGFMLIMEASYIKR